MRLTLVCMARNLFGIALPRLAIITTITGRSYTLGGRIMICRYCSLVALALILGCPILARGQVFGGAAIFEPEIDVVYSGAKLDAQATVSADRKYVTMTLRPQNSQLLALHSFQFQSANGIGGAVQLPGGVV